MPLLAATALDTMADMSLLVWVKFGLLLVGIIIGVLILRRILAINKFILLTVFVVGGSVLMLNWTYTRTEPKILTPVIDAIAPFLPGGSGLEAKKVDPEAPGRPSRK